MEVPGNLIIYLEKYSLFFPFFSFRLNKNELQLQQIQNSRKELYINRQENA